MWLLDQESQEFGCGWIKKKVKKFDFKIKKKSRFDCQVKYLSVDGSDGQKLNFEIRKEITFYYTIILIGVKLP